MGKKDDLARALTDNVTAIRDLTAKAEAEGRDLTGEEKQTAQRYLDEAKQAKAGLEALDERKRLDEAVAALGDAVGLADHEAEVIAAGKAEGGKGGTIGEQVINAGKFKAWLESIGASSGRISEKARVGTSPAVDLGFGAKTLLTSTSVTDGIIVPDSRGLLDGLLFRPFTIRDVITIGTTGSDTVEFVRELSKTNAAAPVPEAANTTDTAANKPESAFTLEKVPAAVKVIAHTLPATKKVLSDAGQMRTIIDSFLRDGLTEELEDQIITGDGTGENFTGLENTSGVQSQAFDTDILRTARKARTLVQVTGRANPTAYLFHPNDWESFDLLKDDQGRYYFGGPMDMGQPRLWGLPVVVSEAVTEGQGIVGDFRKAVLWDREQTTVSVTDSHDDFFIRNLVMFLAELRAAFGVIRPAAFATISLSGS